MKKTKKKKTKINVSGNSNRYDFTLRFDLSLVTVHERFPDFLHHMSSQVVKGHSKKRLDALRIVLLNLLRTHNQNRAAYVAYSRNNNDYSVPERYKPIDVGRGPILAVIDSLAKEGFIENIAGFLDRQTGIGRVSRMRATEKLTVIIIQFEVDNLIPSRGLTPEVIILRNKDGREVDYPETEETRQWRAELNEYNEFISSQNIGLEEQPYPHGSHHLVRIFNHSSFSQGGRFYRGWWESSFKSSLREHIWINGSPTVEIDFSGLHVRMLYAREGIDFKGDVYEMEGVDKAKREILKIALLVILNASGREKAEGGIRKSLREEGIEFVWDEIKPVIYKFLGRHRAINHYFFSGIGLSLQRQDSDIIFRVLLEAMRNRIPVLPVHDSVICEKHQREAVSQIMTDAYMDSIGCDPVLKVTDIRESVFTRYFDGNTGTISEENFYRMLDEMKTNQRLMEEVIR